MSFEIKRSTKTTQSQKSKMCFCTKNRQKALSPGGGSPSQKKDYDSPVKVLGVTLGVTLGPEVSPETTSNKVAMQWLIKQVNNRNQ